MSEHRVKSTAGLVPVRSWMAACVLPLLGCSGIWETAGKQRMDLGVDPMQLEIAELPSYRDTIGALTYYDGLRPLRVRGYGLVAGLGTDGCTECPRRVFKELVERVRKAYDFTGSVIGEKTIKPERIINDPDTAVVVVTADMPGGAPVGTKFDVRVTALPGTKTRSLRSGRLFTTELQIYRIVQDRGPIAGKVYATAAGSVFVNPFTSSDSATKANLLEGVVPGGGTIVRPREGRLVLFEPSHVRAKQIQDRINDEFATGTAVADAVTPGYIKLVVPERFRHDTGHFFALVRALYLPRGSSFRATRAVELGAEMKRTNARYAEIALCLEGLGRDALPVLEEIYADPRDAVSFHAAVAGVRLGDHIAADAMAVHAADATCPFRYQATRALGAAEGLANAPVALRRLLDDADVSVRIAAYEALRERKDTVIESVSLGRGSFELDVVPSSRPPLVYATRSGDCRIAVIGDDPSCATPMFYSAPDGRLTLTATDGDDMLTAIRVTGAGTISPAVRVAPSLTELIGMLGREAGETNGAVSGLGLDYASVVGAVSALCADHTVRAPFVLEQPSAAEMFGPAKAAERPESEL